jgi:hypothetical protein
MVHIYIYIYIFFFKKKNEINQEAMAPLGLVPSQIINNLISVSL